MTKPTTTGGARAPSTQAQASLYQTLKTHLTVLKLDACAEALPRVLEVAAGAELVDQGAVDAGLGGEVEVLECRWCGEAGEAKSADKPAGEGGVDLDR